MKNISESLSEDHQVNPIISLFNGVTGKIPKDIRLLDALEIIRRRDLAGKIRTIRVRPDVRKEMKEALPAVTFAGRFNGRGAKELVERSGFLVLDFDDVDDAPALRDELAEDPYSFAAFMSPSGNGVKVVVRVGTEIFHERAFSSAVNYFKARHGVEADQSGKDISRLCFLSCDLCLRLNKAAAVLPDSFAETAKGETFPRKGTVEDPGSLRPGDDFDVRGIERMFSTLRAAGWKEVDGKTSRWTRPGKECGVSATWDLVPNTFFVWSSNADPFEAPHPYSPFQVYALLKHEGDLSAAASTLRKEGFGSGKAPKVASLSESGHGSGSYGSYGSEGIEKTPFPIDAFPPLLKDFAKDAARVAMVPVSMAGASVLGILSGGIGAGLKAKTYMGETGANLFIMVAAESGTGKDSIMNLVKEPLIAIEMAKEARWEKKVKPKIEAGLELISKKLRLADKDLASGKRSVAEIREDITKLKIEQAALEKKLKERPAITCGDATKEALGLIMAHQAGEAIFSLSSEARGIKKIIEGRYGKGIGTDSGDEEFYTGGYSGSRLKVNRVGRDPFTLNHPCLSILWMLQPDVFRKLVGNPAMVESGLIPRFLPSDPEAEPEEIPKENAKQDEKLAGWYAGLVTQLVKNYRDQGSKPKTVIPTDEAKELFRSYDNQCRRKRRSGGEMKDIAAHAARWPENAWRIGLVIHAVKYPENAAEKELDSDTARSAIEIMEWFVNESLRLMEAGREQHRRDRADKLREILQHADENTVTFGALRKKHGFPEVEVRQIAERVNWLRIEPRQNSKGGPVHEVAILIPPGTQEP